MESDAHGPFDVSAAFAEHGAALFLFALNGLGDRAEAEDCVQETFVRASRTRARHSSSETSVRSWLFAIERNVITDALRTRAYRPMPADADKAEWASKRDAEMEPVLERLALYEAFADLTPEYREVIISVKLEGLGYQELSERTGVPVATLRTRMYYGLRSLLTLEGTAFDMDGPTGLRVGT